jgi:hypothetical protein
MSKVNCPKCGELVPSYRLKFDPAAPSGDNHMCLACWNAHEKRLQRAADIEEFGDYGEQGEPGELRVFLWEQDKRSMWHALVEQWRPQNDEGQWVQVWAGEFNSEEEGMTGIEASGHASPDWPEILRRRKPGWTTAGIGIGA